MPPLSDETAQKLISTVLEVHADVKLVKARQEDFSHRLLGNGQPGEIAAIKDDIEDLQLWRAGREGARVEKLRWTAGISAVVSAAFTSGVNWLFRHWR